MRKILISGLIILTTFAQAKVKVQPPSDTIIDSKTCLKYEPVPQTEVPSKDTLTTVTPVHCIEYEKQRYISCPATYTLLMRVGDEAILKQSNLTKYICVEFK